MKASNGNLLPGQVLKAKSIRSINSSNKGSFVGSMKNINQDSLLSGKNIGHKQSSDLSPNKNDSYFKSGKYVGKAINEDDFFDN